MGALEDPGEGEYASLKVGGDGRSLGRGTISSENERVGRPHRDRMSTKLSFGFKSLLFGLLAGLGAALLSQQAGWIPFTTTNLYLWLAAGAIGGVLLRTAGYGIAVPRVNRREPEPEGGTKQ